MSLRDGSIRRLAEAERRLDSLERLADNLQGDANAIRTRARAAGTRPVGWMPGSVGGGGGETVFRWATKYCFAVVFSADPTLDSGESENPTKDGLALAAAIAALEETHAAVAYNERWDDDLGSYVRQFYFGGNTRYWPDDNQRWEFFQIGGEYNTGESHIRSISYAFQCGYFPKAGSTISLTTDDDTNDTNVSDQYVPCVHRASHQDLPSSAYDNFGGYLSPDMGEARGGLSEIRTADEVNEWILSKSVIYAYYDSGGTRIGWRRLTCTRTLYSGDDIIEPWAFDEGPKYGTTGEWTFDAEGSQFEYPSGATAVALSSVGTAEIVLTWGEDCVTPEPPVTDEDPGDWESFCAALSTAAGTWNKIPGLTITFDGTTITTNGLGTYTDPAIIKFAFSDQLRQFLDANPDVSITYEWLRTCDTPPFNPQTGSGTITHGSFLVIGRNTVCTAKDTQVDLDISMQAAGGRNMFEDICCTPFGSNCSRAVVAVDQIEWYIEAP